MRDFLKEAIDTLQRGEMLRKGLADWLAERLAGHRIIARAWTADDQQPWPGAILLPGETWISWPVTMCMVDIARVTYAIARERDFSIVEEVFCEDRHAEVVYSGLRLLRELPFVAQTFVDACAHREEERNGLLERAEAARVERWSRLAEAFKSMAFGGFA